LVPHTTQNTAAQGGLARPEFALQENHTAAAQNYAQTLAELLGRRLIR
jgi:hypothetical protein